MKWGTFEIKRHATGRYFFVFWDMEKKNVMVSHSFSDRSELEICIAQIRDYARVASVYKNEEDLRSLPAFSIRKKNEGYEFVLIGFEGEVLICSEAYSELDACLYGVLTIKELALEARIVDSV
jgi:uncharacterized protein YegP (UPF0339 family)